MISITGLRGGGVSIVEWLNLYIPIFTGRIFQVPSKLYPVLFPVLLRTLLLFPEDLIITLVS